MPSGWKLGQTSDMSNALMVVDVQHNMFFGPWCVPNAADLLARITDRVSAARAAGESVVFVQNDGPEGEVDEPFSEGWGLAVTPLPGELVVRKITQDVFESNPDLAAQLSDAGVTSIEFCGVQSELCLRSSALGALRHDFQIFTQPELHGTFDGGWPGATEGPSAAELSGGVQQELFAKAGSKWGR